MPITTLRIMDFRNMAQVEMQPCDFGLNIICGDNGSGKTSLLEAIHYLSYGRSFRCTSHTPLVRNETGKFSLFSQLVNANERSIPIGVERELEGATTLRIADKTISRLSKLAHLSPTLVINSQSHQLFESGPVFRRKYLDWGLFYQYSEFLPCWRQFERVLKQRNRILREGRPKRELEPWTDELIKYGLEIDGYRREYIRNLVPILTSLADELLSLPNLDIAYLPGWDEEFDFASILADNFQEEYRAGTTQFGPQRADLDMSIDTIPAKHFLSRGQQKLLICAMILAQGILLTEHSNDSLIYLVDDLPSELDASSRDKLIALLARQKAQIFITAIENEVICDSIQRQSGAPLKVFHVEHGKVKEVVVGTSAGSLG